MHRPGALLAAACLVCGCSSPVRLMPTPTVLVGGAQNSFTEVPAAEQDTAIEVLYATNRMPTGPDSARTYTRLRGNSLRLGVASVRIGGDAKTWDSLQAMSTSDAPGERPLLTLAALRELTVVDGARDADAAGREFFDHVDALLARSSDRDLLVYVHGANTDVERAAAQAAQWRHFTGRNSVVLVFAWPSAGTLFRYGRDVATARHTVPEFALLLDLISRHTRVAHINVLAYSAGAMIASPGLARAADESAAEPGRLRLGEVYYAAPDIDFPVFVENLPRYEDRVRRVTVALNMGDRALSFAQWRHRVSRAGRPNLAEIGPEEKLWLEQASGRGQLDVIAVRPGDLPGLPASSHSFWYDHPWVSSDVLLKFRFHAAPPARGLTHNEAARVVQFWTFPPGYAQDLPRIVRQLAGGVPAAVQVAQ